ncbi:MAG: cytochrome c biosis protein [Actinomycetota bacterium]|jgi:cytochrome c biogenesis protein|nr:cytochrome c biosis protein [Actinomycetota bacterium]
MSETQADVDDVTAAKLDTAPVEADELGTRQRAGRAPRSSLWASVRWAWYVLTSMRTALILLFMLALAAVPGTVLPQHASSPLRVRQYYVQHPKLAPIINRLGGFDVFGSWWFAGVYLLLFISLAGCVIPRSRRHLRAMRARPPAAPRNLGRLPHSASWTTDADLDDVASAGYALLRSKRFRVDRAGSSVAAEKGHLRETGNLLFHLSLLVVLAGVAVSAAFGFTGTVLVKEHNGFSDTAIAYDSLKAGRLVDTTKLPPFSFTLNSFDATYERTGPTRGAADSFNARVTWQPNLSAKPRDYDITVNHPLSSGGANVYLVGHGYAPHFKVTDATGQVFDEVTPFLPQGGTFESQGVVKLPDALPTQLGITGFFLPTAINDLNGRPISTFPAADNPAVVIGVFSGDLGLDDGVPRSVYTLDTSKMTLLGTAELGPGQTLTLPGGQGSVTFVGFDQWATFQISRDPGKGVVLVAVACMVLGLLLSLRVRRRRVWVRAVPAGSQSAGRTVVAVGGLTRTDATSGFDDEFAGLVAALQKVMPPVADRSTERVQED